MFALAQAGCGALALSRLAAGRERRPPLRAEGAPAPVGDVSVVIPARDEAARIGPVLEALAADPDAGEVVVVDDRSSDGTAGLAAAAGARVVAGAPLPDGWVGKQWALQQGLEAARGRWVVTLDADVRPRPGLLRAAIGALEGADLVSLAPRFVCEQPGERLLHPSMACSLVYRFGPVGPSRPGAPGRLLANGQCFAFDRRALLEAGGFELVRSHMTDDVALVRALARRGWRIRFADGRELLAVRMHESAGEVWREWGRSLALADVTPPPALALDVAVVALAMAAPLPRVLLGRAGWTDRVLLAVRLALLAALAPSYEKRGPAFWLSPLADPATAVRLLVSAVRPARTWRGRSYPSGRG